MIKVSEALVPRYEYQPLAFGSDEIYLLRIIKRTQGDEGMHLEIRHASLNDKPTVGVLSYAWGNGAATHRIWLSGLPNSVGIFHVRTNDGPSCRRLSSQPTSGLMDGSALNRYASIKLIIRSDATK